MENWGVQSTRETLEEGNGSSPSGQQYRAEYFIAVVPKLSRLQYRTVFCSAPCTLIVRHGLAKFPLVGNHMDDSTEQKTDQLTVGYTAV